MSDIPETRYARNGDIHIAYQTWGEGTLDILLLVDWVSHLEVIWEYPAGDRIGRGLGGFGRVILLDRRGTGLSDPIPSGSTDIESWIEDVDAVLDAVGVERVALVASGGGTQMGIVYAATRPERCDSLVLINGFARLARAPDYPWGMPGDTIVRALETIVPAWGTGGTIEALAPDADEPTRRWWAKMERQAASPGRALEMLRSMYETDVRDALPSISVRTLVMHNADNPLVRVEHGRFLAERIPGAEFVELPGRTHWFFYGPQASDALSRVGEFLTGSAQPIGSDRMLATLLFTDIVGSTVAEAAAGDDAWVRTLDGMDRLVTRQLARFNGRKVKHTGDGYLAVFDGPGRAVRCAQAICDGVRSLGIDVRAGIHTGEVERSGEDVFGIAVNTAARVVSAAAPGEVLVTRTVVDLVAGSGISFEDRGAMEFKGLPGALQISAARA